MALLIYTTKTTMLMMVMMMIVIEAYKSGPPVNKYPHVCETMSPKPGHSAEPKSSSPPFEIRSLTTNNCYKTGKPITGE